MIRKYYIAHNYAARFELRTLTRALDSIGWECVSSWIGDPENIQADGWKGVLALRDIEDLNRAEVLLYFADNFSESPGLGKHIEFGYALAKGIPIVIANRAYAKRDSVFFALAQGEVNCNFTDSNVAVLLSLSNVMHEVVKTHPRKPQTITEWCAAVNAWADSKGWNDVPIDFRDELLNFITEIAEVQEDRRNGREMKEIYYEGEKPCGIQVELADLVIRVFHTCASRGFNLQRLVELKMAYNHNRTYRHGNKTC